MVSIRRNNALVKVACGAARRQRGFSLVELITILVILGVLAATVSSRLMPSSLVQLQAGRDQLISALFVAQQNAMAQSHGVRLTTAGSTIDIRIDHNDDGQFAANESLVYGGIRYPLVVTGGVGYSPTTVDYNRIGHTTAATINTFKNTHSVDVRISGTGYAY